MSIEIDELARQAANDGGVIEKVVGDLQNSSRKNRQRAASVLNAVAHLDASRISDYADQLTDALNRPEAQTRWECLEALCLVVPIESRVCDKALPGAESALFDEDNGLVRLSAMRFLCMLGATTENRSKKVWPLIDEAIQCYHGDPEFHEMLSAVTQFSEGKIDAGVKMALADRMAFDAENGKGSLARRAQLIVDNLK